MAGEIHKDDIGTSFIATIKDENEDVVQLGGYSALVIQFYKPDKTLLTKDASLYTNGGDGKIFYTTVSGDLNMVGLWQLQGTVAISGAVWNSDIYEFRVQGNI